MNISPIASGSNGNCIYVETSTARVLIDMGISYLEYERRMQSIGRDPSSVDACFVTHEHADHIAGVGVIARKLGIPIYMNRGTFDHARSRLGDLKQIRFLEEGKDVVIGGTTIAHFRKPHDAADPVSFIIEGDDKRFGVITDTGFPCVNTKGSICSLNALLIESNYDPGMLRMCRYPEYLKKRIMSERGHLSNEDSALLLLENATDKLSSVFLGHLSANSNTPELAYQTFTSLIRHRRDLQQVKIVIASREMCSGIFEI